MILMFALRLLLGLKMIGVKIKYLVILYIMENLILMSQDGLIPIENNLIITVNKLFLYNLKKYIVYFNFFLILKYII